MATYACSNISGEFILFKKLLKKIKFNKNDKLYILGNFLLHSPRSVELLNYIMKHDNIIPIEGARERMFIEHKKFIQKKYPDATKNFILQKLNNYLGYTTQILNWEMVEYLTKLPNTINEKNFVAEHHTYLYISDYTKETKYKNKLRICSTSFENINGHDKMVIGDEVIETDTNFQKTRTLGIIDINTKIPVYYKAEQMGCPNKKTFFKLKYYNNNNIVSYTWLDDIHYVRHIDHNTLADFESVSWEDIYSLTPEQFIKIKLKVLLAWTYITNNHSKIRKIIYMRKRCRQMLKLDKIVNNIPTPYDILLHFSNNGIESRQHISGQDKWANVITYKTAALLHTISYEDIITLTPKQIRSIKPGVLYDWCKITGGDGFDEEGITLLIERANKQNDSN